VTVSGSTVSLLQQYQPRVYLMNSNGGTFFRFPNLIGKSIQFTMDLSSSTCSCNAALYLVDFPAGVNNDYYCDAQGSSSSTRCTELDILEANTHAYQVTQHCNAGTQTCQWGCGFNYKSGQGYGLGGSQIDTNHPFQVDISFVGSGSSLSSIAIKLSQSGKTPIKSVFTSSSCSFLSSLASSIADGRLVLAMSYWSSSGMNWLDGCTNGDTCPTSSTVHFSNLALISGTSVSNIEGDSSTLSTTNSFVGTPGFYAVVGISAFVALVAVIGFIVWKKRSLQPSEIV